jgi:hypothetical protein
MRIMDSPVMDITGGCIAHHIHYAVTDTWAASFVDERLSNSIEQALFVD